MGIALARDRVALTKQVKEASDIVAVIGGYVSLRPAGTSFKGLCPFHEDHRPSFQVDPKWQNYRCWACGKAGDVITFVQEYEKVPFLEARAILARRAGIALDDDNDPSHVARLRQLEAIAWAAQQFSECLLDSTLGEQARCYLGERKLVGETVRKFGLGFAPAGGDWLLQRAGRAGLSLATLEEVGLIARRSGTDSWYDRFRDRVMFPVRNVSGQIVGFGGRILPQSPLAERAPKYYNSADSPVFSKSELLFGLDLARASAASLGYVAVVEGYTDVMMAHQHGVANVVATMGTALNSRHVAQLKRYAPRVVLVFDSDAGGATGVDRALEIFVGHQVNLAIATLPEGLDPCDLLVAQGAEPFRNALTVAVDALDYKMSQMLAVEASNGVEGQRRVIDSVLGVVALAPEAADQSVQMKRELIVTRISHRLGVREETVWSRLRELRSSVKRPESQPAAQPPKQRAPNHERELVELLLVDPKRVPSAMAEIRPDEITHPGPRQLIEGLFALQREGVTPDLDGLRSRIDDPVLIRAAHDLEMVGRQSTADRDEWFKQIVSAFNKLQGEDARQQLQQQIKTAANLDAELELLKRLQSTSSEKR